VSVSSGWVLLPLSIAAALSPLSFDLERRVLNRDPRPELPVKLQSTAYTWSQVRGFRRLYARTRAEQPRASSRSDQAAGGCRPTGANRSGR
jgi:hypothetical protein